MKKWMHSLIACGLALVLAASSTAPVFAEEAAVTNTEDPAVTEEMMDRLPTEEKDVTVSDTARYKANDIRAMSEAFYKTVTIPDDRSEMANQDSYIMAMECLAQKLDPAKMITDWGTENLFIDLLNLAGTGYDARDMLNHMDIAMATMRDFTDELNHIYVYDRSTEDQVNKLENLSIMMNREWNWTFQTYYGALRYMDTQREAGKMSADEAAAGRKAILLDAIMEKNSQTQKPNDSVPTALEWYDFFTRDYMAIAMGYGELFNFDLKNGTTGSLMDAYHLQLCYDFHWEHQSYEQWAKFSNQMTGKYAGAAAIEQLSFMARWEWIQEWNQKHPDDPIDTERTTEVLINTFNDRLPSGKPYAFYSFCQDMVQLMKETKIVRRPANERYYQTPGHEMLLTAYPVWQTVPVERDRNTGMGDFYTMLEKGGPNRLDGIHAEKTSDGRYVAMPTWAYWEPFTRYHGRDDSQFRLISYEELKTIYDDYRGSLPLNKILFAGYEGALQLPDHGSSDFVYAVNPTEEHPLRFVDSGTANNDRITSPAVNQKGEVYDETIYYYHHRNNEPNSKLPMVMGIGVINYGSEGDGDQAVAGAPIPDSAFDKTDNAGDTTQSTGSNTGAPTTGIAAKDQTGMAIAFAGIAAAAGIGGLWIRRRTRKS